MALPSIFKPKKNYKLERIGRSNDGGYLVTKSSIIQSNVLISFGISSDCSFEDDFVKLNNVNTLCYDKNVTSSYWKKKLFNDFGAALYNFNLDFFYNSLKEYYKYSAFFRNKSNQLINENIGYDSVTKIINKFKNHNFFFIKVDIEGSEYRILKELIIFQDIICGLIIEFHDLDLHLDRVVDFINNFKLELTHIHPNNFGGIDLNKNPKVVELTFERNPLIIDNKLILPNHLDEKNNQQENDISLTFY
jgi:FkbM family methyltransferase